MRKAAARLGVAAPQTRGAKADAELLGALRLEIGKRLAKISEDDHVKCVVCDEVATEDTEFCPYCGDEGSASETEALEIAANKSPVDEDDDDSDVEAAAEEDETPASEDESEDESDEEEEEEDDEADEDEDEADEDEADEDEDGDGDADEDEGAAAEESVGIAEGAVVAKDVGKGLQNLSKELDSTLERIHQLKRNAVGLSYDIGIECRAIRDKQLFKARGYSSFKAFAEKELPFTRESALQLVAIVEKHSRDDYAKIGYAKMRVIAAVSDAGVKTELLEAARGGASRRELTERATAASGKPKKATAAPATEKAERITLLGKVGAKKQVVRFQNSETGEVIPNVGSFHAKGFTPSAHAELEISDGLFLRVGLRLGSKNELEGLTVRFVRAS